jgi:hypothetical protein
MIPTTRIHQPPRALIHNSKEELMVRKSEQSSNVVKRNLERAKGGDSGSAKQIEQAEASAPETAEAIEQEAADAPIGRGLAR